MCESNDRLPELFKKGKKMPRWSQKLFKMNYKVLSENIVLSV